jgi:oligosaccharide repeat unit polymerase
VLPVITLAALAVASRLLLPTFNPTTLYIAIWAVVLMGSQFLQFSMAGTIAQWLLVTLCATLLLGAFVGTVPLHTGRRNGTAGQHRIAQSRFLLTPRAETVASIAAPLGTVAAILAAILVARDASLSIDPSFSLEQLSSLANAVSINRYDSTEGLPFLVSPLLATSFTACCLAAWFNGVARRRIWRAGAVALLGPLFYSVTTTARTAVLMACVFLAIGWLVSRHATGADHKPIFSTPLRAGAGIFLIGLLAYLAVVLIALLRVGPNGISDPAIMDLVQRKAIVSMTGGPIVMDQWLRESLADPETPALGLGATTVSGLVPGYERAQGVYGDFRVVSPGLQSNVYTIIRGLVEDFGIGGAYLTHFFFGIGSAVVVIYSKRSVGLATHILVLALYAIAFWSTIISPLVYGSVVFAIISSGFLIHAFTRSGSKVPVSGQLPRVSQVRACRH